MKLKMKRLASTFVIIAAFAASASAASIAWGFGKQVYLNSGLDSNATLATESSLTAPSGSYLALVYLGQNVDSYVLGDITEADVVDSIDYGVATSGKNIGKWNPTGKTYDDLSMESGASFTVLFYNGSSFDYVYALDGETKGTAYDSNILTVSAAQMEIASGNIYATTGSTISGVVTVPAIPEPATAALALAGVAMLFRRRK